MTSDQALMTVMQMVILVLVALFAAMVVRTRDPFPQTIVLGFYGLLLAMMFFLFQAPDVALSQIVIGTIALPLMLLLCLSRIRRNEQTNDHGTEQDES